MTLMVTTLEFSDTYFAFWYNTKFPLMHMKLHTHDQLKIANNSKLFIPYKVFEFLRRFRMNYIRFIGSNENDNKIKHQQIVPEFQRNLKILPPDLKTLRLVFRLIGFPLPNGRIRRIDRTSQRLFFSLSCFHFRSL